MSDDSMRAKRRVFIGIGSNLGERWDHLRSAVVSLPDVWAASPIYETEPIDAPAGSEPFLNMVVQLFTDLPARELLLQCQEIEENAGRQREEVNGPRTLDLDILIIEGERIDEPDLQVPHPRMWERRFVLKPLSDLDPDLLPRGWQAKAYGNVDQVGTL